MLVEYFENKLIMKSGLFENEIGPGVLKSSVQRPRPLIVSRFCPCRLVC